MKTFFRKYMKLNNMLHKIVGWILFIILTSMSVLISWQVFARFIIGESLTFSEEASRFLMVWLTMLGAAYALKEGSLIAVDILENKLAHTNIGRYIKIFMLSLASIFYLILIIEGWNMAQSISFQIAPTTKISMFWPALAIPAGGLIMLLNTVSILLEIYIKKGEVI